MVADRSYGLSDAEFMRLYAKATKPSEQVYNIAVDGMEQVEMFGVDPFDPLTAGEIRKGLAKQGLELQILLYLNARKNVPYRELTVFVDGRDGLKLPNTLRQMETKGWIFSGPMYNPYRN